MASSRLLKSALGTALGAALGLGIFTTYNVAAPHTVYAEKPKEAKKIFDGSFGFVDLKLHAVDQITPDTKRLRFELPEDENISGFPMLCALLSKATTAGSWLPTMRPYSPTSDPEQPGFIDLVVKRYATGPMSTHLHALQPGQTHSFMKKPIVEFQWQTNAYSHLVLIAGGAGITPMYQLASAIFRNSEENTKVTVLHGVNTDKDLLFEKEFEDLQRRYPTRFKVVYTVTNPGTQSPHAEGHITAQLIREHIPGPATEGLKILFSGPPGMEKAIVGPRGSFFSQGKLDGVLKDLGYTENIVHKL
ncbi:MAG: NADH-cytochrome b5 reductase [Pycnora praestabilis]|nr:MAG: NADH-cytochrome b5 reductase [Pycnora praestabilis]